jgi:hypothetical protein
MISIILLYVNPFLQINYKSNIYPYHLSSYAILFLYYSIFIL